ncbi:S16 family serine protease [Shewanella fidelis]|uniref:endopeptidase La n=1 Tax=Shewanella fidelis TaxID=173509 RepID=A0AAW8NMC4_9GAMM|nr:S16 family serine protease [Shewanella fidelis]MDR8523686.1 AAA family ATPase [Shewanella fidelis]MDW4810233.1 AAA family ATPase [Shewanella fidelis]MDW4814378.1 AAA family ATPase [Shewanella fidelis]MDW4818469.1 AAA family ATPase [Shewanella fidelis]MDW4823879.1 AAA family ATPase [Shewanella fidelis]
MNSNVIPAQALTPQFTLATEHTFIANASANLLAQERCCDAFTLLSETDNQHMFIAEYFGCNRKRIIESLIEAHGVFKEHVLQLDEHNSPVWQQAHPTKTLLAAKLHKFHYLSGTIRKADLVGRYNVETNEYKPGLLASCHYLFICADSLWKRETLWDLLLEILDKQRYQVHSRFIELPLNCKIVLIGSSHQYGSCWLGEPSFSRHFPLLGELVNEVDLAEHSISNYCDWLAGILTEQQLQLENDALSLLLRFCSKLADHQMRLSLMATNIEHLLAQAKAYGRSSLITLNALTHSIAKLNQRHNASERLSEQNFDDLFINLPTQDEVVGQINGLTVVENAEFSYGEPARITASVHYGDGEVADIERKSELGGNIHAKGMMILSACLYRIFGKDAPLHLNANIVFEQSYQEIDGDSASLAEYCCLISAIAEKPINQSLAATGAIDQFGNVQAIGGVNEKIEGFFKLCKRRGLTGNQGVIIPCSNMQQLNLHQDVIDAVTEGLFSIYQVKHIDEAVEILMQLPAGTADEDNQFPDESLYGLVQSRLESLAGYQEEEASLFARLLDKFKFSS